MKRNKTLYIKSEKTKLKSLNGIPTNGEFATYSLGMLGQSILYGLVSAGLSYYFQSVIFLPALAIGIINAAVQALGIIKEPVMGIIVDKTVSKRGKCRPYLLFMPIIVCICTMLTFVNGIYGGENTSSQNAGIIAWAVISYLLWSIVFTIGDVPMTSMPSVITGNEKARSKILAVSRVTAMLGAGGVSLFFVPLSQQVGHALPFDGTAQKLQVGFLIVAAALTLLGTALFQTVGLFTKERVKMTASKSPSVKQAFSSMWKCKPYRYLFISGILRAPISTAFMVMITFVVYYFGDNGNSPYMVYLLIFQLVTAVGQVAATLLTPRLAYKIDKKKLFICTNFLGTLPFIALLALFLCAPNSLSATTSVAVIACAFLFVGIFAGVLNTIQPIMIADTVDYAEFTTGIRPDGMFFSGQTMLSKIDEGISALIISIVFAVVGFSGDGVRSINDALNAGASFSADETFSAYRLAIFLLVTVPPIIGLIVSTVPLFKYRLSNKEHNEISRLLEIERTEDSFGEPTASVETDIIIEQEIYTEDLNSIDE